MQIFIGEGSIGILAHFATAANIYVRHGNYLVDYQGWYEAPRNLEATRTGQDAGAMS
jgi:hypothetical protein